MKFLLALALLSAPAQASKLVNLAQRQYYASIGLGSTQSVAYTQAAAATAQILSPNGGATELVSIVVSADAYIAQGASPTAAAVDGMYVPAKVPMILEILSGNKFSAINVNGTAGNELFVTHLITFPNGN